MDSILNSIKKMMGPGLDYNAFDTDLIIHINTVFSILTQLGVGPKNGFIIQDEDDVWSDFVDDDRTIEMAKSYIYLKCKLMFDPPQNSFIVNSYEKLCSEYEWRLNVSADGKEYPEQPERVIIQQEGSSNIQPYDKEQENSEEGENQNEL